MTDINYGIYVLERNIKNIADASRTLRQGMHNITLKNDETQDEILAYQHSVSQKINIDTSYYDDLKLRINNELYYLTEENFLSYDIPKELKQIIRNLYFDKVQIDKYNQYTVEHIKQDIKKQEKETSEQLMTIEEIQQEIDKVHNFFNTKKDMYILYRKISPFLLKSLPALKKVNTFLTEEMSQEKININDINTFLITLKTYFDSKGLFTKLFNKEKINILEKVDQYNSNKRDFLKDIKSFLIAKNKLSILLKKKEEHYQELNKEHKNIVIEKPGSEQLSKERYEFKSILETAKKQYFLKLKQEKADSELSQINQALSHNIHYMILIRDRKTYKTALKSYQEFMQRLDNEKGNLYNALKKFKDAMLLVTGSKTLQSNHMQLLNQINHTFSDINQKAIEFNHNIDSYVDSICDSKEISVDGDMNNIAKLNTTFNIYLPYAPSIVAFDDIDSDAIKADNFRGLHYR